MLLRHCCRFWQQCRTNCCPFDKVETNWTCLICFEFVERTKFHEKFVRYCCRLATKSNVASIKSSVASTLLLVWTVLYVAYTQWIRPGLLLPNTDVARSVVCVSVCLCVRHTDVCCAKTDEPIESPFGSWLLWVPGTMYWMGVKIRRIHSQPRGVTSQRFGQTGELWEEGDEPMAMLYDCDC